MKSTPEEKGLDGAPQPASKLTGHKSLVTSAAWLSEAELVSGSEDGEIRVWEIARTECVARAEIGRTASFVGTLPNGKIAAADGDALLCFFDASLALEATLGSGFDGRATMVSDYQVITDDGSGHLVSWSAPTTTALRSRDPAEGRATMLTPLPHGQLASGDGQTITVRGTATLEIEATLRDPRGRRRHTALAAMQGGRILIGDSIGTLTVREYDTGKREHVIERHTGGILAVAVSADGSLAASSSVDGTLRVWDTSSWEEIARLPGSSREWPCPLLFHPTEPLLVTRGHGGKDLVLWNLDEAMPTAEDEPATGYVNAKVVLLGDSGVGKSGLGLVLSNKKWGPTESTHGRKISLLERIEAENGDTRELLLWDLAGQPGYRLVHQLHLAEVSTALVVFDARSETDPFAGVRHWNRALEQARHVQGDTALPLTKFLVAARTDRGGLPASRARIDRAIAEMGFDGFFETSAKESVGTQALYEAIVKSVDWNELPRVTSNSLFTEIQTFFLENRDVKQALTTEEELYEHWSKSCANADDRRPEFATCIGRLEHRGIVRRFSFGNYVLLRPELLDAYASALVHFAREEPDGLGCVREDDVRRGDFRVPSDERLDDREAESLLLLALIEDLARFELTYREESESGALLVFPSQATREWPEAPTPRGRAVQFTFEGPIDSIYSTLAVRLEHTEYFQRDEMWQAAVRYHPRDGGTCGLYLRTVEEGRGELTLFFDRTTDNTKRQFERFVETHLERRSVPESVRKQHLAVCRTCDVEVPPTHVEMLISRGRDFYDCPCGGRVTLPRHQPVTRNDNDFMDKYRKAMTDMEQEADRGRELGAAKSRIAGKRQTRDFDVFLCHNGNDKDDVKKIAQSLIDEGYLPWLDQWELPPGIPWQRRLEEEIGRIRSAAVFVGKDGVGPWQREELDLFLREFQNRRCPVIPVILESGPMRPDLPPFLAGRTWVDFRDPESRPLQRLIWGIKGTRDDSLFGL